MVNMNTRDPACTPQQQKILLASIAGVNILQIAGTNVPEEFLKIDRFW